MHHVLNILLPHAPRFRSLAILTDRWAPMQTALECLGMEPSAFVSTPRPLPSSLPNLESLVLMRCNEFVGYHSEFTPADRKGLAQLPFSALLKDSATEPVLPRLKKLVLSGVHVDWSGLPHLLPLPSHAPQPSGLETLELSYHCTEVRPSEREFRALLARSPALKNISIRVSGPKAERECGAAPAAEAVSLPNLEALSLGYDEGDAAAAFVSSIDAPRLTYLALEDASCPSHEEAVDAELLLRACASGRAGRTPFPRAQALSLCGVDCCAEVFEEFYEALSCLRNLEISHMFLLGGQALSPNVKVAFAPLVVSSNADEPQARTSHVVVDRSSCDVPSVC